MRVMKRRIAWVIEQLGPRRRGAKGGLGQRVKAPTSIA